MGHGSVSTTQRRQPTLISEDDEEQENDPQSLSVTLQDHVTQPAEDEQATRSADGHVPANDAAKNAIAANKHLPPSTQDIRATSMDHLRPPGAPASSDGHTPTSDVSRTALRRAPSLSPSMQSVQASSMQRPEPTLPSSSTPASPTRSVSQARVPQERTTPVAPPASSLASGRSTPVPERSRREHRRRSIIEVSLTCPEIASIS